MQSSETISVAKYLSVAVNVAEACGMVIRAVYESGELEQRQKGANDPVTIADLKVQKTIEETFKHFFPTLVTMGEESAQSMEGIVSSISQPAEVDSQFVKMEMLQENLAKRAEFNEQMRKAVYGAEIFENFDDFNTSNAVVWIDPLDGTSDFVKGNLTAVTVLIGLAIDGLPKIGVVHNPFSTNENEGSGFTIFGTQEHGAY